ncbi:MAG TPA: DUF6036 family nucleotidyltransferase [Ktedonosporobacter sp.]|jgi:hypothetical protein|nr:DUF6036 family nucleotidyltransferase [Ktedonosporobacter sp.]
MDAHEIEKYLTELGTELKKRGVKKPVRIMIIGGAYMLLLKNAVRTTNDIDIFWLEEDALQQVLHPLRESVQAITNRHALRGDWFNYLAQILMQDEVIVPDGKLWKRYGPLHIYAPSAEYILALKIAAGRDKDLDDCAILLPQTNIKTRQQAQQLLGRYLLPEGQEKNAEQIERSLNWLFKNR